MTATEKLIGDLPAYRRIWSEYRVLRLETDEDFAEAVALLRGLGIQSSRFFSDSDAPTELRIWSHQYRHGRLRKGDVITFRSRASGRGYSVITYRKREFDQRYRKLANWREKGGGSAPA